MFAIENILQISSDTGFEKTALELFAFQAAACQPYREFVGLLGIDTASVDSVAKIPFMPIEFFKTREVYCGGSRPEIVFTSSSTGGQEAAKHYVTHITDYEATFFEAFRLFYDSPADIAIYALLPGYLEREGSSLVYMVDRLIAANSERRGGFYLHDQERLIADIKAHEGPKMLFGVSYALLDLAEKYAPDLTGTIVMETGGMKGRREELPKSEFHSILCDAFGVGQIHSEYGMAELTSQAYSSGSGIFHAPPWMRVLARDLNDPFEMLPCGRSGGINIIDLANINSCAFIQTQDAGMVFSDGSFSISGRIDRSEVRGCNLLVQ